MKSDDLEKNTLKGGKKNSEGCPLFVTSQLKKSPQGHAASFFWVSRRLIGRKKRKNKTQNAFLLNAHRCLLQSLMICVSEFDPNQSYSGSGNEWSYTHKLREAVGGVPSSSILQNRSKGGGMARSQRIGWAFSVSVCACVIKFPN